VCCIPIPAGKGPDPTLLPIDLVYIINAFYLERTNSIEIHCVLPEDRTVNESPADLYKFIYTVRDGERKGAEQFCKELLQEAYRDITYGKRLLVLINPFSGQGKAKELFEYNVRPIFTSAECVIDVKCSPKRKKLSRSSGLTQSLRYRTSRTCPTDW
jgi:sphingosine kinase